jgi:hypothetical protein
MFDIRQSVYDKDGEQDERKVRAYIDGLMQEFAASPEGKGLLEAGKDLGWAGMMMEYGLNHLGVTPAQMSPADFDEVVFELFPRKVSTEPDSAAEIVEELRAFWQFVQRQHGLANAAKMLEILGPSATDKLYRLLADPSNYAMAKSFFMQGKQAGFDMTTQEGLDQFMQVYNSQLLAGRGPPAFPPDLLPPAEPGFDTSGPPAGELTPKQRAEKRKAHKRQRQARKRNRKK